MKSNLLLNKIKFIQTEYKELLVSLLPKLKSNCAPEALDEINIFWLRHIETIQLYLKTSFPSENSYVFTAATFMDFKRKGDKVEIKIYNQLLMMDAHLALQKDYQNKVYFSVSGELCTISKIEVC